MTDHDALCPSQPNLQAVGGVCYDCALIARVRADERGKRKDHWLLEWSGLEAQNARLLDERNDLRARVEALPTWDGYHAPVVVLADVLALLGGDDE